MDNVLGVMASCGMYDWSGEWIYRVGLPAQSGVGRGILAVLPGQLGIGVFSPLLDAQGNSVRAIRVCMDLARDLALHLFNPSAVPPSSMRRSYNATQVNSRRRLSVDAFRMLRRYGERIRVMELQGALLFSTFEPVIRELVRQAPYCQHIILNFAHVASIDEVCLRMLRNISEQLAGSGVRLVFCHAAKHAKCLGLAGFEMSVVFPNDDAALEFCENEVLASVMAGHRMDPNCATLAECGIFRDCDEAELKLLDEHLDSISHAAGETIIQTGANADELFVGTSGSVEVRLRLDANRSQRLDVLFGGMSFGEVAFLDGSPRSADIVAVAPVTCRVIHRAFFNELGEKHPLLKAKILNRIALQLCERLRQANLEISALRN